MKKRNIVGGAQKVVILYLANIGRISSAWKRSKSKVKTGVYRATDRRVCPQSALPQPVSEMEKCMPLGSNVLPVLGGCDMTDGVHI